MTHPHPFHDLLPEASVALRRRALTLTRNPHHAEDLVQATLLKAWIGRDSYQNGTNLRAWLFTILRNTFISELRKYRHESQDIDGYLAGMQAIEASQDHALALNELVSAIALLPEGQRRALILMGTFGYSQLEVADACGCTIGTVKSRVSRGRAALARIVDYDGIPAGSQTAPNA